MSFSGLAANVLVPVETYPEAGRFSFSIMEANRAALWVLSSFLLAAAAVGIVNSMLMSVHERTREIGTIRALGTRRGAVIRLFVFEGFALGVVAAALGVLAGGSVVVHYAAQGIPMNNASLTWMAGGDRLFTALTAASVVRSAAIIVGLSTLAALYPAHVASRLEPREALHHV
jgi:putative ABC transport system permease protein